jgi:hypothetical protein
VRLRWAEPLLAGTGVPLVGLLARTWRYHRSGWEHPRALYNEKRPFIFALWHSRILPLLYLHRNEAVVLLISRHRDGGHLATLAERWGYQFVRGSSKRGGEVGLLGIVRALKEGAVVAVTPDGPRGPAQRIKPGIVAAAQHADVPIVPATARPARAWVLGTWDRMCIPKPFTAIEVAYGAPIHIAAGKRGLRTGMEAVQYGLHQVTHAS